MIVADECGRCWESFMPEDIAHQIEVIAGHDDGEPVMTYLSYCKACWIAMMIHLANSSRTDPKAEA